MFLHHPEVILSEITNVSSLSHFPNERLVVLAKPLSPLITLPNRSKLNPWQKSMRPILPGLCGKTSSVGLGFSIRLLYNGRQIDNKKVRDLGKELGIKNTSYHPQAND